MLPAAVSHQCAPLRVYPRINCHFTVGAHFNITPMLSRCRASIDIGSNLHHAFLLIIGKDNLAVVMGISKLRVVAHHQRTGGDLRCAEVLIVICQADLPVTRIDHHVDAIFPVTADMHIVSACKIYHILTADNRSAAATDFKAIFV